MYVNVFNNKKRKIICVNNYHNTWGYGNNAVLRVGKQYTLTDIEVASFFSLVTLEEFPDMKFNSALFNEVEE